MMMTASQLWALLAVFLIGSLVNLYCLALCKPAPEHDVAAQPGWVRFLDFSPAALGGFSYWRLALISVLALFLELLMIRWVSSEIGVFAYFKNFVLVACFLGFGLGCYISHRRINLMMVVLPLLTLAVICDLPWPGLRDLVINLSPLLGATIEVHTRGVPYMPLDGTAIFNLFAAILFILPVFGLIASVFIPFGQLVSWYIENAANGIQGYTVNIAGSLTGIALYTFLCFMFQPPAIWMLLAAAMLTLLLWKLEVLRWVTVVAFAICLGLLSIGPGGDAKVLWSPYQKLTVVPMRAFGENIGYLVRTNSTWYQHMLNLSPGFVNSHPRLFGQAPPKWNAYNLPYRFYPHPASVLVLGAGSGNDVAAGLRNGAGRVVAVEIDPLILKLGRRLHPEQPYSSPRVQVVVNDARSYIENSKDRFDLIVFALLDSHTTTSYYSNIRIDNYVYTEQALKAARRLLKPDGLMVVKFWMWTPWISGRMGEMVQEAFGRTPIQVQPDQALYENATYGRFYIEGSQPALERALAQPEIAEYVSRHKNFPSEFAPMTTDNWPYFYQNQPGVPAAVIIISALLVLLCWLFLRQTGTTMQSMRWHFFFLGAGFMLLEAQIISKMALLFGTTWVVNSIAVAGLLTLIVAANFLVEWKPRVPLTIAYVGIFVSILVAYAVPLETFFFASIWIKALTATMVLCLPVFFAGIVFIRSFARDKFRSEALGSNLFGALVGGMLESLSLWTGMRSLLVLAALLYLGSLIALRWEEPAAATTPDLAEPEVRLASLR